jgi:hypothetical protein
LSGLFAHAGVQEDYPDIFPKELESPVENSGWDLLASFRKIDSEDRQWLPGMGGFAPSHLEVLDSACVRRLAGRFEKELRLLGGMMDSPRMRSNLWRTYQMFGGDDTAESLQSTRAAQILLCKAVIDARDGNVRAGVETGLRVTRLGLRFGEAEPILIDLVAGCTLIKMGAGTVAAMAPIPGADSALLRRAANELDACDTAGAALKKGLHGEARWQMLLYESLVQGGEARRKTILDLAAITEFWSSTKEKDAVPLDADALRKEWEKNPPDSVKAALQAAGKFDWTAFLRGQAGYWRAFEKADNTSYPAFKATFHPPDTEKMFEGTALAPYFKTKNPDLETGVFYMNMVASASARIRQARALLLLRAYELDHGRLPDSLDKLVPDYWPSVPRDPFDGTPLHYSAATRSVWCVGKNLRDDRGVNDPNGKDEPDDVILTLPKAK